MRLLALLVLIGAALTWSVSHGGIVRAEQPRAVAAPFADELPRTLVTDEMIAASLARLEAAATAAPRYASR